MKTFSKSVLRATLVAGGLLTLGVGAASAGEWRIDASRCPDLREGRIDRMYNNGRAERAEDRRDEAVINCPARAWYYVRGADDSRLDLPPPRPTAVIVRRDHFARQQDDFYYRDARGAIVSLNLRLG